MAYFKTYTATFFDIHNTHPAEWRVDILDDQANGDATPINLQLSATPLTIERINDSDDKGIWIIGRQATLKYEYIPSIESPAPSLFFDVDERRFRMEVYKNGILDGVYYVKPDACQFDFKMDPYTVTITAVDGLSFLKSVDWDAYDNDGRLTYRWISLYDTIMDRGLLQVLDDDTEINVINTLRPINAGDPTFLNGLFVHSDRFIDFVKGPISVFDVLENICKQFYMRLFVSQNKIWCVRMQDLLQPFIIAENYISGIMNALPLPTINRTIGPNISGNDATPVDFDTTVSLFTAIKQVEYDIDFRSINVLPNFDWFSYGDFGVGNQFEFWPGLVSPDVQQHGAGTKLDPYTAFIQYNAISPGTDSMGAFFGDVFDSNSFHPGDILEYSIKFKWINVGKFKVNISLRGATPGEQIWLSSSGEWINTVPSSIDYARSGKRKFGSMQIKSIPIPAKIGSIMLSSNLQLQIDIYTPSELNTFDPESITQGIEIYPIKIGQIPGSSSGAHIKDINVARFSKIIDSESFHYLDTGSPSLSNTISVTALGVPSEGWISTLNITDVQTIQRHSADAPIDQYAKSVMGIDGKVRSNTIEFWHIFTYNEYSNKKMIQLYGTYDVKSAIHSMLTQEILPENGADTVYTEIDIEDSE